MMIPIVLAVLASSLRSASSLSWPSRYQRSSSSYRLTILASKNSKTDKDIMVSTQTTSPETASRLINQGFKVNALNLQVKNLQAASSASKVALINKTFKTHQLETAKTQTEAKLGEARHAYDELVGKSEEALQSAVEVAEEPLKARNAALESELVAAKELSKEVQAELRSAFVAVAQSGAATLATAQGEAAKLKEESDAKTVQITELEVAMSSYMASAHAAKLQAQKQARADAEAAAAEAVAESVESAAKAGASAYAAGAINAVAVAHAELAKLNAELGAMALERDEYIAEREREAESVYGDKANYKEGDNSSNSSNQKSKKRATKSKKGK